MLGNQRVRVGVPKATSRPVSLRAAAGPAAAGGGLKEKASPTGSLRVGAPETFIEGAVAA
jgi:hypothetical protein